MFFCGIAKSDIEQKKKIVSAAKTIRNDTNLKIEDFSTTFDFYLKN